MGGEKGRVKYGRRAAYKTRKRSVQRLHDRKVAELYLRGKTIRECAMVMGLTYKQVQNTLCRLREQWREKTMMDMNKVKLEQLSKLDEIERAAWDGWERSTKDAQTTEEVVESYHLKSGRVVQNKTSRNTLTGQSGCAAFLAQIGSCVKMRCDILGLKAPLEIDVMGHRNAQDEARNKLAEALNKYAPGATQPGNSTVH